jgi:hypothetical protein
VIDAAPAIAAAPAALAVSSALVIDAAPPIAAAAAALVVSSASVIDAAPAIAAAPAALVVSSALVIAAAPATATAPAALVVSAASVIVALPLIAPELVDVTGMRPSCCCAPSKEVDLDGASSRQPRPRSISGQRNALGIVPIVVATSQNRQAFCAIRCIFAPSPRIASNSCAHRRRRGTS